MENFIIKKIQEQRKRKSEIAAELDREDDLFIKRMKLKNEVMDLETNSILAITSAVLGVTAEKERAERSPNEERDKSMWENGYNTWNEKKFKRSLRVTRDTFDYILAEIVTDLIKKPTPMKPDPISPETQLALTLYRLAHGCSFSTLEDVFGWSIPTNDQTFNHVCRVLVQRLYDRYVRLPETDEEWITEIKGFIENYEFPCIGAWDGFHVYISSNLKSYFSFKKRYSISNMGLVACNKRFLYAAVGAPGSTHDARLLRHTSIFKDIVNGDAIPDRQVELGDFGSIPLVTVGDNAFPKFAWLLKAYDDRTTDPQQRFFNKKMRGARVVCENAYGMLKGRWRILYKKTEMRNFNLKYVVMACIMLHNLCIERKDPCEPRWKLQVNEIGLFEKPLKRSEDCNESNLNRTKISNWLWMNH